MSPMLKSTPRTKARRIKIQRELTVERLHELLDYDPLTGIFRWKRSGGGRLAGTRAGTMTEKGYTVIGIDDREYRAGRLAWFHYYGEWPRGLIRYIDRHRDNNSLANLKDSTPHEINCLRQQPLKRRLPRGVKKNGSRFHAEIAHHGKTIYLGSFRTPEEAHECWKQEARRLRADFLTE
jgi:hypothetical protein